jgi:hypothetical protein
MTGLIAGVPIEQYVRDSFHDGPPSLSSSIARRLISESPRHAAYSHPRLNPTWAPHATKETDLGTIAHALFLENDRSRIVLVEEKDWRKPAAQDARDDARAAGNLPLLARQMPEVEAMVEAARDALALSELAGIAVGAKIEHTLLWEEDGALCRCRPDLISADTRVILDAKFTGTSAEPESFARGNMLAMGYDVQAIFAMRGANALLGPEDRHLILMVVETAPPYGVSFPGLDPQFVVFADAKFNEALRIWKTCLAENKWPGYPSRIAWASPPEWAVYRFGERAAAFAHDSGHGEVSEL